MEGRIIGLLGYTLLHREKVHNKELELAHTWSYISWKWLVHERVGKIHWSFIYNRMTVASQNTVRSPHFGKLLISAFFFWCRYEPGADLRWFSVCFHYSKRIRVTWTCFTLLHPVMRTHWTKSGRHTPLNLTISFPMHREPILSGLDTSLVERLSNIMCERAIHSFRYPTCGRR